MKSRWIILLGGTLCLTACGSGKKGSGKAKTASAKSAPVHFLIEAEDAEVLGEKADDGEASGAASVVRKPGGSSGPVVRFEIPPSVNELSVWIRRKGGALGIGIGPEDSRSVSDPEAQFTWTSFGEIPPGGEGRQLSVSVIDKTVEAVSIDCVLFSHGPVEDKDALLTPLPPVRVDPGKTAGPFRAVPSLWGKNISLATESADIAFQAPRLVRYQNNGLFNDDGSSGESFLKPDSHEFDEGKIRQVVTRLLGTGPTPDLILNISNWPRWMDTDGDGILDDDKTAEYVETMGRLAEIVLETPGASGRILFEITSGQDGYYYDTPVTRGKPHRVAELAAIFIRVAQRIHQVSTEARVGGPSARNGENTAFHEQFIAYTAPELDFYSMYLDTDAPTQAVESVRAILAKNSKVREIPLFLHGTDPIRIPETSRPVRDAWFLAELFSSGASYALSQDSREPSTHLFHILNTEFTGPVARLETDEPDEIAALVTESGDHLLISHRGSRDRKITLPDGKWTGWMLGKDTDVKQEITVEGGTDLPGVSVLYLEK